jgi:hypothetical protein
MMCLLCLRYGRWSAVVGVRVCASRCCLRGLLWKCRNKRIRWPSRCKCRGRRTLQVYVKWQAERRVPGQRMKELQGKSKLEKGRATCIIVRRQPRHLFASQISPVNRVVARPGSPCSSDLRAIVKQRDRPFTHNILCSADCNLRAKSNTRVIDLLRHSHVFLMQLSLRLLGRVLVSFGLHHRSNPIRRALIHSTICHLCSAISQRCFLRATMFPHAT